MTEPRTYDIVALPVPIAYNAYGDHDRHGTVFALAEHEQELRGIGRDWPEPFPDAVAEPDAVPEPHPLVRPLVLRARVGERVVVHFRNELPHRAGIHPQGVRYDVERADGGVVGANPDSAADPGGGRRRYVWDCVNEGVFFFGDLADLRGSGRGSQAHGLFGALVVEPAGASWTDPETGDPVEDGLSADVHVPGGPGFREYVLFLQDTVPNDAPDGGPDGAGRAVCYRAEPAHHRARSYGRLAAAGALDPAHDAVAGDEQRYSSWLFGDPATPLLRAYAGDRARIRLVHAGMSDTHVFGLDAHRWHTVPGDPRSPVVDAVGIGPQQALTVEPVGGAGSVAAATGDVAWHGGDPDGRSGAWGIWRVFDVAQDGSGRYPDGTPVRALRPLPGHAPPPAPTPERPGFPAFVAGEYPQRAPRPPRTPSMPAGTGREPTALERAAFCPDPRPGEAFTKVAPPGAPVRRHHLVAMAAPIPHFRNDRTAWTDPDGVLFAPAADVEAAGGVPAYRAQIASGERAAAPVVLRAAAGEVVELSLTNALPPGAGPGRSFQPECGAHAHLVGYDPLVADGASVGWNYLSGATTPDAGADHERYRTWVHRWYCDSELGTVVLGDGVLGARRRHGLFGCLVVEPAGSRWTDPHDPARPAGNASAAVVTRADGTAFREQVLAVADRVPLVEHAPGEPAAHGRPVTPDRRGTTAVGYRCEPLSERPGDPADWFSSTVHDDPGTPLVRGYPGEELRIRLYQGAGRDQHSVVGHGLAWPSWPGEPASPRRNQHTLGPGQAADLHVGALPGPGDRLWSLAAVDDTWLGAWGLVRLHDGPVPDLPPLPGARPGTGPGTGVPDFDPTTARRYHVRVRPGLRRYSGSRADPLALVCSVDGGPEDGPLVLRARAGEWVEVTLTNELSGPPPAAEADPPLPGKDRPGSRTVSDRVSLQAAALDYDVRDSDGAFAGRNPDSTAKPGHSVTYRWYCATPGAVLLTDRADVRTHRHRGLAGALVVEPSGATPLDPSGTGERWTGEQAVLRRDGHPDERELVLLLTDGLRLYSGDGTAGPVPDLGGGDPGDHGQKAFNHRSAHLVPERPSLADARPPTPLLACAPGDALRLHLVVAGDRPRPHSFTVHGHDWPVEEHLTAPRAGATGGLGAGAVRSLALTAGEPGDYAYRTGALRWALAEGLWGLLRVRRP